FVHMGPLHHSLQTLGPFEARDQDLVVNLRSIRAAVWMFYVVAEIAFLDFVRRKRYWRVEPPDKVGYDPADYQRRWERVFLIGPDPLTTPNSIFNAPPKSET